MARRSVLRHYEAEEDEEDDDDDVRHSWSTEKNLPASKNALSSSSDLADWRGPSSTRESIEDLEESVRQALEILNTSIHSSRRQVLSHRVYHSSSEEEIEEEEEEEEEHEQDWRLGYTADGKPYYYDNGEHDDVQNSNRFTVAELDADASHDEYDSTPEVVDEHEQHQEADEHEADDEREDDENHEDHDIKQSGDETAEPEAVDSEWQTAYTAKGRVYYYNRRTRESSWTK